MASAAGNEETNEMTTKSRAIEPDGQRSTRADEDDVEGRASNVRAHDPDAIRGPRDRGGQGGGGGHFGPAKGPKKRGE